MIISPENVMKIAILCCASVEDRAQSQGRPNCLGAFWTVQYEIATLTLMPRRF
jgi:hypothetical protein